MAINGPMFCETCTNGGDPIAALEALDMLPGAPRHAEAALAMMQRGEITADEFLELVGLGKGD